MNQKRRKEMNEIEPISDIIHPLEYANTKNIHEKIVELKKEIESNFIKLGGYLKLVKDEKLYKEKGCITFEEYIAMPELAFDRSTVYAIIGVYEDFFMSNQSDVDLLEIGYSKLNRIRQFKGKEDFEEWIYKAKNLSLSDLGNEIREAKGKPAIENNSKVYEITCPHCGKKFEYYVGK